MRQQILFDLAFVIQHISVNAFAHKKRNNNNRASHIVTTLFAQQLSKHKQYSTYLYLHPRVSCDGKTVSIIYKNDFF